LATEIFPQARPQTSFRTVLKTAASAAILMLKAAVVRDYPFGDPDDEIKQMLLELKIEGIEAEIALDSFNPAELKNARFDFVIIDYGGMSSMGSHDTALHNLRYVLNLAEDRPGKPFLVWTWFTADLAREIYDDLADAPPNVFIYTQSPSSVDRMDWDRVRALLQVPNPLESDND
jgi:hypothetical protein